MHLIFGDWSKAKLKYDVFSETHIFVLTNNLICFYENDVRTSQKATYAQFKIYRTIFIDEIGPRIFHNLTVLPAKSESDAMFCLKRYQGLRIDGSLDVLILSTG